ncbi:MAG TPA: TonB-dependent receptor [Longimicrobiaceae bacterium]|nr:TonB-dependent receptor [Longimicrobiaceae bacterium]
MSRNRIVRALAAALLGACLAAPAARAQTSTASLRGYVRGPSGEDVAGASVTARNTETNQQRSVVTDVNGFYALPGLRPGPYQLTVRRVGFGDRARTVQLMVGQTLDLNFDLTTEAVAIAGITATAAPVAETRTSELATNVTREQVQNLPTPDRNFLSLAVLAPGTQLQNDRIDGTRKTFTAGAQGAEQVNVFIDGASYKNDILQGGVAGQDASRGNPFPRNAIREFRVTTQNFKAEYQKASSAIITATTRSGTNEWEGNAFLNYQHEGLTALDQFQRRDRAANPGFSRPDYQRFQLGANVGGPIILDRLHFFGSFERNDQNRGRRVSIVPPAGFPALDSINFAQYNGEFDEPFRSTLFFGKLTFEQAEGSFFDLSYTHRHENDIRDFGGLTPFESATRFKNDVNTAVLKHTWTRGDLLNEATGSFQRYRYNPTPARPGTVNRFFGFGCCAQLGSNISEQDFTQKRFSLRNDLSWSGLRWLGEHVVKGGVNLDFLDYDIIKRNAENPRFVYEPWFFGFSIPQRVEFQTGDPNFGANNTQVGLYVQDDWNPSERLTLNLGVRWDYESNMMNYDYETPQAIVDSLTRYQDRLFLPLDTDRYFTDGDDRSPFFGAIQPRLGFSFALDRDARTSIFGGWGIFYDRTLFDHAIEEAFALQHPSYRIEFTHPDSAEVPGRVRFEPRFLSDGRTVVEELTADARFNTPEMKLIPNDLRPPKAQHFNLGIRRAFGEIEVSAAYAGVRSRNQFTFYWANQNFTCPDRSFAVPDCFQSRQIPGFSSILFGDDRGKTWYDALQVKVDRPYRARGRGEFGWGAGLAVTVAERETEGFNDLFSFPNPADYPRQVRNDEPVRIVGNWIVDVPWVWGIQFSGLLSLGSGARQDVGGRFDCNNANTCFEPGGFEPERRSFIIPDAFAFRNLDLRVRKEFVNLRQRRLGVTAELFNVFNHQNLGCFNLFNRDDPNFGTAGCVISDPRRLQIGVEYNDN